MRFRLSKLVKEVHENAKKKGWHEIEISPLEVHALIHSEISEATEQVRQGVPYFYNLGNKPEGEAVELVDAVIRILDYFGKKGWDIEQIIQEKMDYNATRTWRHGGKCY